MKKKEQFEYDDYVREREHLSKYENDNYENYEKTILTLASAFLAFSVSFLALLRNQSAAGSLLPTLTAHAFLIWSWISFAISVVITLLSFLMNALALRFEVTKLEEALEDTSALEGRNPWDLIAYLLYVISGIAFGVGLVLLLTFSTLNIVRL